MHQSLPAGGLSVLYLRLLRVAVAEPAERHQKLALGCSFLIGLPAALFLQVGQLLLFRFLLQAADAIILEPEVAQPAMYFAEIFMLVEGFGIDAATRISNLAPTLARRYLKGFLGVGNDPVWGHSVAALKKMFAHR